MPEMTKQISVNEAIAAYSRIPAVRPKRIPLFEANGLRVAEDVLVKRPVPAHAVAGRDGWAVAAQATQGASRRKPLPLGDFATLLDAGSQLPPGTDAILPLEDGISRQRGPSAIRAVRPGAGVIRPGGDAITGSVLVPAGTRITFAVAVACAACGISDVLVRRPVVDIIFNSPGFTRPRDQWIGVICSAIRGSGSQIGAIQFAAGDSALLAEALASSSADVITIVGGTGHGPGDCSYDALAAAGEVVFRGIRLNPGSTAGFGMVGDKAVFLSPGGIADMIAVNIVLSWPFARQAFGRPPLTPPSMRATLSHGLPAMPNESRLILALYAGGVITPYFDEPITPVLLATANASIYVPEGSRHRRRGEQVQFMRLGTSM